MSIRPLCKELQEKAIKELNEDTNRIPEDIDYIKKWLKQSRYIISRTDDQWILSFLRGCKFSLERTKEKLEKYHTLKTLLPEFYKNRDPMLPEIQRVLNAGAMLPLPHSVGPDAPKVIFVRVGSTDPTKTNVLDIMRTFLMIMDIILNEDDQCIIAGSVMVQDMKGLTMAHMTPLNVSQKATVIMQDGYPFRPKAYHCLNAPSFFETVYALIKPFFTEKMKNRMVIYTSDRWDDLYKTIPKNILPKDYGGDGPTMAELTAEWKQKVESYREWFSEDEKYGTNEKKRPGRPKTSDEYFGIEGSFRKLNVD